MAKKKAASKTTTKSVETITHAEDKRRNIPTVEYQSVVKQEQQQPVTVKYPRNVDLDPQFLESSFWSIGISTANTRRVVISAMRILHGSSVGK